MDREIENAACVTGTHTSGSGFKAGVYGSFALPYYNTTAGIYQSFPFERAAAIPDPRCAVRGLHTAFVRSGAVVETYCFRGGRNYKARRTPRVKGCSSLKKIENERFALRNFARLLNANFKRNDPLLTFTLSDEGLRRVLDRVNGDPEKFMDRLRVEFRLFLDRARHAVRGKKWKRLRYVAIFSTVNGETGEAVRPHVHVIFRADCLRYNKREFYIGQQSLTDLWVLGAVDIRRVEDRDLSGVAAYLYRQAYHVEGKTAYMAARCLKRPRVIYDSASDESFERAIAEAKAQGCIIQEARRHRDGTYYMRYIDPGDD